VLQQASNIFYNEQNNLINICVIIIDAFLIGTREWASYIFVCNMLCYVYNNLATSKTDQYISLVWPIFRALNRCTKYIKD